MDQFHVMLIGDKKPCHPHLFLWGEIFYSRGKQIEFFKETIQKSMSHGFVC